MSRARTSAPRRSAPVRQGRPFVANIADATAAIEGLIAGPTPDQSSDDRLRVDAVVTNLTVLGKAAGRVPSSVVAADPQIPWPRMRAMRTVLVAEYFGLDHDVRWGTVTDDLKPWCLSSPPYMARRETPAEPCPQCAFKPCICGRRTQISCPDPHPADLRRDARARCRLRERAGGGLRGRASVVRTGNRSVSRHSFWPDSGSQ